MITHIFLFVACFCFVPSSHGWSEVLISRRNLISAAATTTTVASASAVAVLPIHPSLAVTPSGPAEAVRRSAANLPGYGSTDVFYPELLLGTWRMSREVSTGGGDARRIAIEYPVRFLSSVEDNAVVADRGYNQAELEKALRLFLIEEKQIKDEEDKNVPVAIRSYVWTETNPNTLQLVYSDGSQKEIKVTKRSTERSDSTISSSEYQRVTQDNERGIPVITARRVLTKWKIIDDVTVEGIELVYDVGGGGSIDPLSSNVGSAKPQLLSKSLLELKRMK